jgi:hypothetical protein
MTHRKARHKLGSRSVRRANTNGKNMRKFPDGTNVPLGNGGRVTFKYRFPRPTSRKVAVVVAKLLESS